MKKAGCIFASLFILFNAMAQKPVATISKSWRNPETIIKVNQFNKILVVGFIKDPINRKMVEDDLVKLLKGKGLASYVMLASGSLETDLEGLEEKLRLENYDGALVLQLMNPDSEIKYMAGTGIYPAMYNDFFTYYEPAGDKFRDPGYLSRYGTFVVESNFYSINNRKLIWNALTNPFEAGNMDKIIPSIGKAITAELKKQGFLF